MEQAREIGLEDWKRYALAIESYYKPLPQSGYKPEEFKTFLEEHKLIVQEYREAKKAVGR